MPQLMIQDTSLPPSQHVVAGARLKQKITIQFLYNLSQFIKISFYKDWYNKSIYRIEKLIQITYD